MVGLEIQVLLPKEKRHEFLQAFELLSAKQCSSSACVGQSLYEGIGEGGCFLWIQRWSGQKALEDYMQSTQFRSILGAIKVLGELKNLHLVELREAPDHSS